jgi:hypothetical protein
MGDSRPDNGAGWPPDDGAGGLPELPPEWGTIVIPDDASELDNEADEIRRELRRDARRHRLRGFFGRNRTDDQPTLGIPLMIMAIAVLTTMISLFVVTWGRTVTPGTFGTSSGPQPLGSGIPSDRANPSGSHRPDLVQVVLHDAAGGPVQLANLLPAVIMLVDGCRCPGLVLDVAAKAPTGLRVIAIGQSAPTIPDPPVNVTALADPGKALQVPTGTGSDRAGATTLVVDHEGHVIVTVPALMNADDLPALDPAQLT